MTIEEATPGRMVARLPLQHYHLNGLGVSFIPYWYEGWF
jgi:hypothetical protein